MIFWTKGDRIEWVAGIPGILCTGTIAETKTTTGFESILVTGDATGETRPLPGVALSSAGSSVARAAYELLKKTPAFKESARQLMNS